MRIGHNPARFVENVDQPAEILVCVVNFIPFIGGYYAQSLDVLKACLNSIHANTPEKHDLMVFDNHSCKEVRDYLVEAREQGIIQYLVLSDKNIGKIGAWNFMFGAAQAKYIAFSDSDVLHHPGWLAASLELFEAFPNVGMVTARPYRTIMDYSAHSLEWARQEGLLQEGRLDWELFREHDRSLGRSEAESRERYAEGMDYRVSLNGKTAYLGANHFQMVARADVLKKIIPLESKQPMRGEQFLDIAVDKLGCLRLSTGKAFVTHMGNTLPEGLQPAGTEKASPARKSLLRRLLWLPGIKNVLLWLNNRIFRLYFHNVD